MCSHFCGWNRCEAMERLVQLVIQDDEADSDTLTTLGQCLCRVLRTSWTRPVFPSTVTVDSIEDSIGRPLFVLFRNLTELSEDDSRRLPLLTVLSEMYTVQSKCGYLLLYYLQASVQRDTDDNSKVNNRWVFFMILSHKLILFHLLTNYLKAYMVNLMTVSRLCYLNVVMCINEEKIPGKH